MERVYIAGPMTGYKDCNRAAFRRAAKRLRRQGWDVVNPAEFDDAYVHVLTESEDLRWACYLSRDILHLASCQKVYFLKGWRESYGARIEQIAAHKLGLATEYEDDIKL